jgi:hypothetical protein
MLPFTPELTRCCLLASSKTSSPSRLAPLCRRVEYRHTFRFVARDPVAPVDDLFVVLMVDYPLVENNVRRKVSYTLGCCRSHQN